MAGTWQGLGRSWSYLRDVAGAVSGLVVFLRILCTDTDVDTDTDIEAIKKIRAGTHALDFTQLACASSCARNKIKPVINLVERRHLSAYVCMRVCM